MRQFIWFVVTVFVFISSKSGAQYLPNGADVHFDCIIDGSINGSMFLTCSGEKVSGVLSFQSNDDKSIPLPFGKGDFVEGVIDSLGNIYLTQRDKSLEDNIGKPGGVFLGKLTYDKLLSIGFSNPRRVIQGEWINTESRISWKCKSIQRGYPLKSIYKKIGYSVTFEESTFSSFTDSIVYEYTQIYELNNKISEDLINTYLRDSIRTIDYRDPYKRGDYYSRAHSAHDIYSNYSVVFPNNNLVVIHDHLQKPSTMINRMKTYDIETGRQLTLADIIKPESIDEFRKLISDRYNECLKSSETKHGRPAKRMQYSIELNTNSLGLSKGSLSIQILEERPFIAFEMQCYELLLNINELRPFLREDRKYARILLGD